MAGLDLVDTLIDRGAELYRWLIASHLDALGYAQVDTSDAQRLVVGPASRLFAAGHRFDVWESDDFGRLVWFWLDSEIPHMSSIVACIGIPWASADLPLFVMNLNLKLKAGTFNTIMGYRGQPAQLKQFHQLFAERPDQPPSALAKKNPATFEGVRLMFWLARPPIDWSISLAQRCLSRWFGQLAAAGQPCIPTKLACNELFVQEMISLHSREGGGVYDAVFGSGWLSALFREQVFG